jgi:Z1 domain
MDRGFTIEGLTVTYMPRGPGIGNADTIQQRARFFGYKRPYLGFCRIFLEQDALNAFEEYVRHEEEMRQQLQRVSARAIPLRDWKRAFILSPDLRPCRNNVIQYDYARGRYADEWFLVKMVETPPEVAGENETTLRAFEGALTFAPDTTYQSDQPAQQHLVAGHIPLRSVLSDLLVPYRVADASDTQEMTGLMLQLSKALETDDSEAAVIYRMRPTFSGVRDVDSSGRISSIRRLFQGPTRIATGGSRQYSYPGDMAFRDTERVSVQIHRYDLRRDGHIVAQQMPVIAVWVPARLRLDWIVQHQPQ